MTDKKYHQNYKKSAAIILLNSKEEIPLLLRDDLPAYSMIGGEMDGDETHLTGLIREIEEETYYKLQEEPILLCKFEAYDPETGEILEHCNCYQAKIDDNVLQLGEEGIGLSWFPLDNVPVNMYGYSGDIIKHSRNGPRPETFDNPVRIAFHTRFQEFSHVHRSQYTSLKEWNANANVIAKRQNALEGKTPILKYDPVKCMNIVSSLLQHHLKNNG